MIHLTDDNFDSFISTTKGLILVDFWAARCAPCRSLAPVLDQLAVLNPDVIFVKLNTDENPDVTYAKGINAIPTLSFYKNGQFTKKLIGLQSSTTLQKTIDYLKG